MDEFEETKRQADEGSPAAEDPPGAEGGGGENADTPPAIPSADDDSAVGDTDQHSDADA